MLRRQFRRVASALTRHVPEPHPAQGKRTEGTRGGFRLAAAEFAHRAVSLPEAAYATIAFLSDTLDWLNPFHHGTACSDGIDEEIHASEPSQFIHHL